MNPAPSKSYLQSPAQGKAADAKRSARNRRNLVALAQLANSSDHSLRRRHRDALVRDNLPLVYAIAGRMSRSTSLPFEDLSQAGSIGLLRAIEAFQPSKGRSLSSFAVPYIRGAMLRELRDRQSLMKIPRELWELRRQATVLQERSRLERTTNMGLEELALALGCNQQKLQEAMGLHRITQMASLDAPVRSGDGTAQPASSLLDDLADPASLVQLDRAWESAADPAERQGDGEPICPKRLWMRQQLDALSDLEQALIRGHLDTGATWVELGLELALHPRQAQRRYQAVMNRLQQQVSQWAGEQAAAA